ncbi:unnamed protein product [Amaranthus hypochondriacus]
MFPGNCEIVEIEEESKGKNYMESESKRGDKNQRSLASNNGNISSLEDDLNQLFEMFNRRASSHEYSRRSQASTSRKNASKKPVKASGSYSPGHGISERVNIKQALRGLCLSQASEMAAMKHSSKLAGSSEAGRVITMHRNVVKKSVSDQSQDDDREGMLEISLVPEEMIFDAFGNVSQKYPSSDIWLSDQSSFSKRVAGCSPRSNQRGFGSKDSGKLVSNPGKPPSKFPTSYPHGDDRVPGMGLNTSSNEMKDQTSVTDIIQQKQMLMPASSRNFSAFDHIVGDESLKKSLQKEKHSSPKRSSSSYGKNSVEHTPKFSAPKEIFTVSEVVCNQKLDRGHKAENTFLSRQEHTESSMTENGKVIASKELGSRTPLAESLQNEREFARKMAEEKEMASVSIVADNRKLHALCEDEHVPNFSPRRPDVGVKALGDSNKLVSKEFAEKLAKVEAKDLGIRTEKKISSKIISSTGSPKGKKASKSSRNAKHLVKPLIKTKNFVRRKHKKKTNADNSSKNVQCEFNNDLYSGQNPIVCPRCQCVVTETEAWREANEESSVSCLESPVSQQESRLSHQESPPPHHESLVLFQDSPVSPFVSLSAEVSSCNVISDVSTLGPSSGSSNKSKFVVPGSSRNLKLKFMGDFTQSSKDSPGECSSSTSISEETNLSRPSFCDRPHMSKDVRWEAIRCVKFQNGTIGLRNFNLLKKLGCGDIGTVYLAELIGTNCLFAIKVMDNEFLARRNKISRAQTEKEILRMLDHPFLPTLYCQFTSDNLSCLVMEYCPGGDLHVLRQRQPGRCFIEQAARFYVAEVLLALEYLHMLGVIYRDLKPENILVREDGHIMLSDFDLSLRCAVSPTLLVSASMSETTSRKVSRPCVETRCVQPLCIEPSFQVTCFTPRLLASSNKSSKLRKMKSDVAAEMRPLLQLVAEPTTARSNSFVGTHEYLAPEIIKGEGHGSAVDWWTFGIFLYELLYGRTPFKGAGNEETLANVVLQNLKFPDSPLVSLQARDLISALLVKEPDNRLGTERGAAEIKQHPFFEGLNWALIRCALPPELPEYQSYEMPKPASLEKNNKYIDYSSGSGSGSGSAEHLEFEVF